MHKLFLYIGLYCTTLSVAVAQIKIEKPISKSANKAFAIFIDQTTYDKTEDAVRAYQKAVEADGLPTYIISGHFDKPDDVKKEIIKLYNTKQSLEGVVFVGDIPVPMIRNAQHMTTAFKMNEKKFTFQESSVPSDRFYDDLNLNFDYIQEDPKEKHLHYYKLKETSPQQLNPTIYSARIRYPKAKGGDAYRAINDYLLKVAHTRRDNVLDHMVAFTGAAYNSECLVAWKDDMKAYKEDFPYIAPQVNSLKQLNFRMDDFMKFKLFDEMQRKDVDILLMRKHGTPTKELINNAPEGKSLETRLEALRRELYSSLRRAQARQKNVDSLKNVYSKKYSLSPDFFARLYDNELIKADSTIEANSSIHTQDLRSIHTHPLYVILDACYNGSFHENDYIAGHYIFNEGHTIAAQGNTRNVLQDKWTMNQVGLLSYGVRLGQVHNMNVTLENHLIGDPTFHFGTKDNEKLREKLNTADTKYWTELLKKNDPIYQAIALRKIAESTTNYSSTLLEYFKTSPYRIVRLQALRLLAHYNNDDLTEAVKIGLTDEYEMIARQAAILAGRIGDKDLLAPLANAWVNDKSRQRVQYNIESNLRVFNKSDVLQAFTNALQESNRANKEQEIEDLNKQFARKDYSEVGFEKLMNKNTPIDERIDYARTVRNYNFHQHVDAYLSLINDKKEDTELRVVMAEALGWFNHSTAKAKIVTSCQNLLKTKLPKDLKAEIEQTIIRLK